MIDASDHLPIKPDRLLSTLEQLLAIEATDLEAALQRAADLVGEVLGADAISVFVYDAESESLVLRGMSGTPLAKRQRAIGMDRLRLVEGGRAVEVFRTGVSHRSGRTDKDPQELPALTSKLGVRSAVIVPVQVGGQPRGVLAALSVQPERFRDEDREFLEAVSRWISMVMHRAELTEALLSQADMRGGRAGLDGQLRHLTPRQLEVALLIANGYTNRQIAQKLVLTSGTVANHVAQTLERLGLDTRVQVAALIAELGLHRTTDDRPISEPAS